MRLVVIGAGVIGCAVAFECARRGAEVQVVDRRRPGQGATQAAAGMLVPYIEGHDAALLALGVRGLAAWDPFMALLGSSAGTLPEYGRNGTLESAYDDAGVRGLQARARVLAQAGVTHTTLCGADARRLEPALSAAVQSALEIPVHGYVSASGFVEALVAGGTRHGVSIVRARALGIEAAGAGVLVKTDAGVLLGNAVVVAAGSWSAEFGPGAAAGAAVPPVRPVKGQLLHLRTEAPVASRVLWGPDCYVVPRRDGSVLVGATVEDVGFDERPTVQGIRALTTAAAALLPALDTAVFEGVRVGLRPATRDAMPVIGPSSRMARVYYATGHYRNGVLLSPLTAQLVADMVLEARSGLDTEALRPARFGL